MAPQVVDEISKQGDFKIVLGGESRDIAVLFVDIRGFTPMSESLQPEEVVGILNEYLALTTSAVLSNEGTLDKFIGDATMAVFNAPFDLEDYVYKAILTALAISELCVTDLSRILDINQTTVSHQLRFLKSAGIVKCCRQGKIVFYSLTNDAINDVILKGIEFLGC